MLKDFKAFQLAKEFRWACKSLKISKFLYDQLFRASASIALNAAEGSGKRTPLEQRRYYSISMGSLRECEAILELEGIEEPKLLKMADDLGAIFFTLSLAPENRTPTAAAAVAVTDGR